ncbi:MAG TPA: L-threonylcarbamoyladenylate synthase [Acidimicrobiales bacterium]|nr:L-threonylcarbamoyladenylate synthase [Acidimicrobiales bacterium]
MSVVAALGDPPPAPALQAARRSLVAGEVVGLPTDTVYGLAVDPFRTGAADRLFALKARPRSVALPVLVADLDQALALTTAVPGLALAMMRRWWPGPLTLVLPRRSDLTVDLGTDEATVGIRCPAHPVPRSLAAEVGPLATTSANRHGEPTLTKAAEVAETFGESVAVVLDAGPCDAPASTVVDCTGVELRLLRAGPLSWEELLAAVR